MNNHSPHNLSMRTPLAALLTLPLAALLVSCGGSDEDSADEPQPQATVTSTVYGDPTEAQEPAPAKPSRTTVEPNLG